MPCYDYYDHHPEAYFKDVTEPALKARIAFAESALCQSLETISRLTEYINKKEGTNMTALGQLNYTEAVILPKASSLKCLFSL